MRYSPWGRKEADTTEGLTLYTPRGGLGIGKSQKIAKDPWPSSGLEREESFPRTQRKRDHEDLTALGKIMAFFQGIK